MVILLLTSALFFRSATPAAAGCVMQAFGDLAARYETLVQDLTALVRSKAESINWPTGRWAGVAAADKQAYALLDIKGSLGNAQKTASDLGASVGTQTAKAHLSLISDDVMKASRTSLIDVGQGFGAAVAAAGVDDAKMASCLSGVGNAISGTPVFAAHTYTSAEVGGDLKTLLLRTTEDTDPPAIVRPGMWTTKLPNAESGAVAELAVGARLKRAGNTHVEIGADELQFLPDGTLNPLYQARVDIVTDTEIHQVGLTAMTIKGKLDDDMTGIVQGIKRAMDAKPGRHYYFSFTEDNWTPIQSTIDDLNERIAALYAPSPASQVFTASDFRYIPLDP
jgi:hypothetical protein